MSDGEWRLQAACRGQPPHWWFPVGGNQPRDSVRALAICGACPVRVPCRDLHRSVLSVSVIAGGWQWDSDGRPVTKFPGDEGLPDRIER